MGNKRNPTIKYMPAECVFCLAMIFPGITANQIAKRFKLHPALITNRLNTLESRGILLSEDSSGGLYPFSPEPVEGFDVYASRNN